MPAIRAFQGLRSILFATTFVAGTMFAANAINAQHATALPAPVVHDHTAHAHTHAVTSDPLWAGYTPDAASTCGCDNCEKKRKPRMKGQVKKVLNTFTKGIDILIFGTSKKSGCDSDCDDGCDAIYDTSCDSMGHASHQHLHQSPQKHLHPLPTTVSPQMAPAPTAPFENYPSLPEVRSAQPLPSIAPKARDIRQAPKDPFVDDPISTNRPQVRRTALPGTR